jgi:hypothetical protein
MTLRLACEDDIEYQELLEIVKLTNLTVVEILCPDGQIDYVLWNLQ